MLIRLEYQHLVGQLDSVKAILTSAGTAGGITAEASRKLIDTLSRTGRPVAEIKAEIDKGIDSFAAYSKNILTSADNALRLQNGILQLSASTGNFGDVISAAGTDLSKMNNLLAVQSNVMSTAMKDTGLAGDQVENYWSQLATIPGVLKEVNTSLAGSSNSMNVLSASIQLATGSRQTI